MRGCRGCLRTIVVAVVVVVAIVLGLGYVGLVPAIAGLFGSDKPRDLGIRFTPADLESYNAKGRTRIVALPPGAAPSESIKATGSVAVTASFTDEELTAVAAEREGQWQYWPVSNCQIKVHDDGTVEASGLLQVDRARGYAAAMGLPVGAIERALSTVRIGNRNPPVYVRGRGSVTDGKVSIDLQRAEIGRLPIPPSLIERNKGLMASTIERVMRVAGIEARSVTFGGGELKFQGTKPETRALSPSK